MMHLLPRANNALLLLLIVFISALSEAATLPATAVSGKHNVGNDGSAQYSIPVHVPAGVQGVQPKLELTYSSNAGNGVAGMGFDISGLSSIHRCETTIHRDGYRDGVNFDDDDQFCLDGQRLIPISGDNGAHGTEYRTEFDSITKVVSSNSEGTLMEGDEPGQPIQGNNPLWFKVYTADGRIHYYGDTNNSRRSVNRTILECPNGWVLLKTYASTYCFDPVTFQSQLPIENNVTRSYEWSIRKTEDRFGNKMEYSYYDDDVNGEYRIDRINYNYFGSTPKNYIKFNYTTRNDKAFGYFAGAPIQQTKILSSIQSFGSGYDLPPIKWIPISNDYTALIFYRGQITNSRV